MCTPKGIKERVEITKTVDEDDGASEEDDGIDLGERADVVEGPIDDKDCVRGERHGVDEVFGISKDGAMGNHHALGTPCSTCGIKYIGSTLGTLMATQLFSNLPEGVLGHVLLQGCCHTTCLMQREIVDEEVDGGRGTEADGIMGTVLLITVA